MAPLGNNKCQWITALCVVVLSVYIFMLMQNIATVLRIDDLIDNLDNSDKFNKNGNRYLTGNYAPVDSENVNIEASIISGSIPSDISGVFMRVGPNPIPGNIGKKRYHWFDGHGMIHSMRIINSSVMYSNQYVKTPRYNIESEKGKSIFVMLGEMQGVVGILKLLWNTVARKEALFNTSPNKIGAANTAIVHYGKKLFVCHEASLPFAIQWHDNNSFSSVGYDDMHGGLHYALTAHPKVDPRDGNLYFVSYSPLPGEPSITYGAIRDNYVLKMSGLDLPESPWVHDMMITENYILVLESSVVFSPAGILRDGPFHFDFNKPFRVGVAHKYGEDVKVLNTDGSQVYRGDSIQWFEAAGPALLVHAVNAWEEGGKIVLWAPLASAFDGNLYSGIRSFRMYRITLNLEEGTMSRGTITREYDVEFPRIHPDYLGVPSRYAFASIQDPTGDGTFVGFVKFDLFDRVIVAVVEFPPLLVSGEMVPIKKQSWLSAPPSGYSGDGSDRVYLASFFFDKEFNGTEWRVYDGESMVGEPVVRVRVPRKVPYGFHGEWIAEADLQEHVSSGHTTTT
jgi:carotenoid cleavage dioxygenase-like enzyme